MKKKKRKKKKKRRRRRKKREEKDSAKEQGSLGGKSSSIFVARAIKTAIEYHRVFTNERSVRWLQTRTKPWNTHEEQTVLRFGDRGPPDSRILTTDTT